MLSLLTHLVQLLMRIGNTYESDFVVENRGIKPAIGTLLLTSVVLLNFFYGRLVSRRDRNLTFDWLLLQLDDAKNTIISKPSVTHNADLTGLREHSSRFQLFLENELTSLQRFRRLRHATLSLVLLPAVDGLGRQRIYADIVVHGRRWLAAVVVGAVAGRGFESKRRASEK